MLEPLRRNNWLDRTFFPKNGWGYSAAKAALWLLVLVLVLYLLGWL